MPHQGAGIQRSAANPFLDFQGDEDFRFRTF